MEAGASGRAGRMSAFVKGIPAVDRLIRRNPLFYGGFRRLLAETERASLDERRALAIRLLERSRRWAAALPGYAGSDLAQPLSEQPILTKAGLLESIDDFTGRSWLPLAHAATGGTTGVPLPLVRSLPSLTMEQAMIDHLAAKAGVDLQQARVAVLRGDAIKDPNDSRPPFWRQIGAHRLVLSSNHLNAENFASFERALTEFRTDVLLCYPSSLELLTELAGERKSPVRFQLVITSSENLRPGMRDRVKRIFGASLIDYYGMAERVCAAYSVEDGVYRFILPYGYAELLEETPGRYRIIGTSFWNRQQPLRRYDSEDIALLPAGATPEQLERITLGLDPFAGIEGRISDFLLLADGTRIYTLDQIPYGVHGAATVQVIQETLDTALIVIVPNVQFSEKTVEVIRQNFYIKAPRSMNLRVEVRDSPYRLPNGKAPNFISQLAVQ
jgi:phenylacetate-CoA ligase